MPNPTGPFWFIRDGDKLIQCDKEAFDRAIVEGKSVKYKGYANKKIEKIAEKLENARMTFLSDTKISPKFRSILMDPLTVIDVQIINIEDIDFWFRESKNPKYQK